MTSVLNTISNTIGSILSQFNVLRNETDYRLDKVLITCYDKTKEPINVFEKMLNINLYEDIFSNFISGDITLYDTQDLAMLFPIIGEEIINIQFHKPGSSSDYQTTDSNKNNVQLKGQSVGESDTINFIGNIVGYTKRQLIKQDNQVYILKFIASEFINSKKTKVYQSYQNETYGEIVKKIYDNYMSNGQPIEIIETLKPQHFISAGFTPSQAINILASKSVPVDYKGTYLFYQTLSKGFKFVPTEYLFDTSKNSLMSVLMNSLGLSKNDVETWLYQVKNTFNDNGLARINENSRNVDGFEYVKFFDTVDNLISGMYGSKVCQFDLIRGVYNETDYTYTDIFKNTKHLESNQIVSDESDFLNQPLARVDLVSSQQNRNSIDYLMKLDPKIESENIEEILAYRHSQLQQMNNIRFSLTLPGNTERIAGKVIKFEFPNSCDIKQVLPEWGMEMEKYLSGNWLITSINHNLTKTGYNQHIEIVKDSFKNKIEYIDPIELYETANQIKGLEIGNDKN